MCNYPEESSRPLSTMECQNAFDQLVAETEQPKVVEKIDKLLRIVGRKPTEDPNFDKIEFNRDPTFAEVKQMCSDDGLAIADETLPVITKETIDQATEAFDEIPTDEAPEEVNEASNTEFFEEDAPDEGEEEEPNPVKDAFAKVAKEADQKLKDEQRRALEDDAAVDYTIRYLHDCDVTEFNWQDHREIIDDTYERLTDSQRWLLEQQKPWVGVAFRDVAERIKLEIADEKSKMLAEELTAKMVKKEAEHQTDEDKRFLGANGWHEFFSKWDRLPKDIQDTLGKIPGFTISLNSYLNDQHAKKFDYNSDQKVNEMRYVYSSGKVSAADAVKSLNDPGMINDFIMGNDSELEKLKHERSDFSMDNFSKASKMFSELQKQGKIPPTNVGANSNHISDNYTMDAAYANLWNSYHGGDLGDTVIIGPRPCMTDKVGDGNGHGKGDCTVRDIFPQEYAMYKAVNESMPIGQPKKQLSPEESLINLMSDMPKSMVDKILTIPGDDWKYSCDNDIFKLKYSVASRIIKLTLYKANLKQTGRDVFQVAYNNDGPGCVEYLRGFEKLSDIAAAGPNANRLYQWFGRVITKYFTK